MENQTLLIKNLRENEAELQDSKLRVQRANEEKNEVERIISGASQLDAFSEDKKERLLLLSKQIASLSQPMKEKYQALAHITRQIENNDTLFFVHFAQKEQEIKEKLDEAGFMEDGFSAVNEQSAHFENELRDMDHKIEQLEKQKEAKKEALRVHQAKEFENEDLRRVDILSSGEDSNCQDDYKKATKEAKDISMKVEDMEK